MTFKWVRPQQAPDDEVEVFSLGSMRSSGETPDAEDDSGEVLGGRYELLEVLACGGTAAVYRTRDQHTGAHVATKVLYKGARAKIGLYFGQEGRLAARIRSPHLVHASDFGEDDGRLFIVFDLVPGRALSELYDEPMPWRELLAVVLQVLKALAVLHRQGVVHRDVKPDNVIVSRSLGELHVTLLDLGFAVTAPEKRVTGAPEPCRRVFGTFGYIAPELFAGRVPEPRCDLYSVGALMYTMLTTLPVPDLRAAPEVLVIPPPSVFLPGLPEAVDDIVVRALSDVEARFQSVQQMADAVRAALAIVEAPVDSPAPVVIDDKSEDPDQLRPFRESAQPLDDQPASSPGIERGSPLSSREGSIARKRTLSLPSVLSGAALGVGLTWLSLHTAAPPAMPGRQRIDAGASPSVNCEPMSSPPDLLSTQPQLPAAELPLPAEGAPPAVIPSAPPKHAEATLAASTTPKLPNANTMRNSAKRRRSATFAEIMAGLEDEVRSCAIKHSVPTTKRTVQVRRAEGEPLFVRVWGLPSDHPFAGCVTTAVRLRQPPLDAEASVQSFTFFNSR